MMKRISYPFSSKSPLYPGTPPTTFREIKSIAQGDSANTTLITLSSHAGTHIDVPRHFCPGGKTTREMLGTELSLSPVYCFDILAGTGTGIGITDLKPYASRLKDAAGIFIRTGMYRLRATDPETYMTGHPWIQPDLPQYLRSACPSLRMFGIDTISISNPQHRTEGRECHRAFLCREKPIIIAEDLDFSDPFLTSGPLSVTIIPWINDDLDGVPVQIFAEVLSQGSLPGHGEIP
jgi:arylformamidase